MTRRRGVSLVEIVAAGVVLAVMLVVCLEFFRGMAAQREARHARRVALQEVANVMERLGARSWDELTPEAAAQVRLSAEAEQALGEGELSVEIVQPEGEPPSKRIAVLLRWPAGPAQPDRSVRLVAWRYRVSSP